MRHFVLVGPMGAGKTTVGREVAMRLGVPLCDSDEEIQRACGTTAREFADKRGVDELHRLEANLLVDLLEREDRTVIAPAASVVDDPRCRKTLARRADVVWLHSDPATLAARAEAGSHRPVLDHLDHAARAAGYHAVADAEIDVTDRPVAVVADLVLEVVDPVEPASLRLLGGCGSGALIDSRAAVVWWCAPEPADSPILWRLLEPHCGQARWIGASGDRSNGAIAGAALATDIAIGGVTFRCRDGIARRGDGVVLVRTIRSVETSATVMHELTAGGFDPAESAGQTVGVYADVQPDRSRNRWRHQLRVDPDHWSVLVIAAARSAGVCDEVSSADTDWVGLLDELEDHDRRRARRAIVPGMKPERTHDALAVLAACTDRAPARYWLQSPRRSRKPSAAIGSSTTATRGCEMHRWRRR